MGSHVGVGEFTTHFRTYFSGDWDFHWNYDLDLDPWPYISKAREFLQRGYQASESAPLVSGRTCARWTGAHRFQGNRFRREDDPHWYLSASPELASLFDVWFFFGSPLFSTSLAKNVGPNSSLLCASGLVPHAQVRAVNTENPFSSPSWSMSVNLGILEASKRIGSLTDRPFRHSNGYHPRLPWNPENRPL